MADIYVRSGGDAGAWTGTSASLAAATTADSAGDVIYVASDHAESNATAQTWACAGTSAGPTKIICATTAAAPPTATATSGTCATTGNSNITLTGWFYLYGLTITAGSGANASPLSIVGANAQESVIEACALKSGGTSSAQIRLGSTSTTAQPARITLRSTDVYLSNASSMMLVAGAALNWVGGSVLTGSAAATSGLIRTGASGLHGSIKVSGVDFTHVGVTGYIIGKISNGHAMVHLYDCKLPAFTTGGVYTGTLQSGDRISMYNCDSADPTTNVCRLAIHDYFGSILSDTSVYADDGVDDGGGVGYSWKMTTSADAEFPHQLLISDEIVRWNDTTGSAITVSVEIAHDGASAFKDNEAWLEVLYIGASGTPLGTWTSDRCSNLNLNSEAAAQSAGSATWTGDSGTGPNGSTTWNLLKLSPASFTPNEKGFIHARVCVAVASKTIYVDPKIRVA